MFSFSIRCVFFLITSVYFASALSSREFSSNIPRAESENVHKIKSKVAPGVTMSYKQTYICETTPGVRAFSGYIHLPSSLLDGFGGATENNASMFFWYFESRNDPKNAPLSLYLGGGPGTTSLLGATSENGPCYINPDSNSTRLNPWSWNNNVSMLYIDQPVKVGFSYDVLIPSVLDLLTGTAIPTNGSETLNTTSVNGVLASQDLGSAANTTMNAARILWKFTQIWLQEFPEHNSSDDRVSIWGNSYGGHWVPGAMAYFQSQNEKIQDGTRNHNIHAKHINLDTLGLTNGCVDSKIEAPFYPEFAFNNTYGLQAISEDVYHEALTNLTKKGGCYDLIDECRSLAISDPGFTGTNETVNAACALATLYCFQYVQGAYTEVSGRNPFDISKGENSVSPPEYTIGYMNQDWVQRALGVPLNFSISSTDVVNVFFGVTGDPFRVSIDTLNYVADSGIKIALIHGDRDYRCNWLGGEAISLALSHHSAPAFHAAGYEFISPTSNSTSPIHSGSGGGLVRQHDALSFSRVFSAGHAVGAYQPETVSHIFDRVMFNRDVATGKISTTKNASYSSTGPQSSFGIKNELPPLKSGNECYLWDAPVSCTEEQIEKLRNGTGVMKNFILVEV